MRIIPARAGFTIIRLVTGPSFWDHPRSRGVYLRIVKRMRCRCGSSPLARGLLFDVVAQPERVRIIPARAGFTSKRPPELWPIGDHPRSRGVYQWENVTLPPAVGSSPLARGLRQRKGGPPRRRGIIPARAGFTTIANIGDVRDEDHPRSRGVYNSRNDSGGGVLGSSPLARGLLNRFLLQCEGTGIIPARAGFTLGDRRDSNGGPPYQGAFAFTGDLGTARLSCGSVVAGQRSTTTPSPV